MGGHGGRTGSSPPNRAAVREDLGVRIADEIEAGFDRLVDRVRKRSTIFDHVWQALMRFIDVLAGRLAAAISYYAFFAAFSLAVLGLLDPGPHRGHLPTRACCRRSTTTCRRACRG